MKIWAKDSKRKIIYSSSPQPFWQRGLVSWKTIFHRPGWERGRGPVPVCDLGAGDPLAGSFQIVQMHTENGGAVWKNGSSQLLPATSECKTLGKSWDLFRRRNERERKLSKGVRLYCPHLFQQCHGLSSGSLMWKEGCTLTCFSLISPRGKDIRSTKASTVSTSNQTRACVFRSSGRIS